eukprot:2466992-Pleurochrysis_carterae.AAC.1
MIFYHCWPSLVLLYGWQAGFARMCDLGKTYLPGGVPTSCHATHAPAADILPSLVELAIASKQQRAVDPAIQRPSIHHPNG